MDRLSAMEVFVRVAESGSFSRAAETLNLANASVTSSVRNLERHLNVVLISRDSRRLRLTAEGAMLLPRARELLQSFACLEDDVRTQVNALSGSLHIEVPISLGQTLLAPALPAFAKLFPGITTTVILTNQPHNLIERGLDVAVRLGHVEDPELVARPLFEARYVICGDPAVVASLPEDPAQLDMRLCISMLPGESRVPMPWELTRGDQKIVLQPNWAPAFQQFGFRHGGCETWNGRSERTRHLCASASRGGNFGTCIPGMGDALSNLLPGDDQGPRELCEGTGIHAVPP